MKRTKILNVAETTIEDKEHAIRWARDNYPDHPVEFEHLYVDEWGEFAVRDDDSLDGVVYVRAVVYEKE